MDTRLEKRIENVLHQNWSPICHNILERFTTVSKSDLDAAITVDDLVTRISAKSDFPTEYVENQLAELCLVGAGAPMQQKRSSQDDGGQQYQEGAQFQTGQRNRSSQRRGGGNRNRSRSQWAPTGRAFGTYGN